MKPAAEERGREVVPPDTPGLRATLIPSGRHKLPHADTGLSASVGVCPRLQIAFIRTLMDDPGQRSLLK